MTRLPKWLANALAPKANRLPTIAGRVFVVGSAPRNAPPPPGVAWTYATVNASQTVLAGWGGEPTLTLFGRTWQRLTEANLSAREVLRGSRTRHLICVGAPREHGYFRDTARTLGYGYDDLTMLTPSLREEITERFLGTDFDAPDKPSNGVMLALLSLHLGASDVTMSGFSLTLHGHAYNDKALKREHMEADRMALERFRRFDLPIVTNDPVLAEESGLRLRTD
jgi:hypothetical protein